MSEALLPGANAPLRSERVDVHADADHGGAFGYAVAVLPDGGAAPWLPLQEEPPAYVALPADGRDFGIVLGSLPATVEKVHLALYGEGSRMLRDLGDVTVKIGGYVVTLSSRDLMVGAVIFAQLYRRAGVWKVRALSDGVFEGVEELGRRISVPVNDLRKARVQAGAASPPPVRQETESGRKRHADWSGSGSLIADRYLITNAHVVGDASEIWITSFAGRTRGEPVIVDETNDVALVRLSDGFGASELLFRDSGAVLGETAYTLGYPMHGVLGSGPQFTQGSVSNLLGPHEDVRFMQITCPVQPGSSGGPVFDASGLMIGMVTAVLRDSQNVNFALRTGLVQTLLEAAGVGFKPVERRSAVEAGDLVRAVARFVWRVECFR